MAGSLDHFLPKTWRGIASVPSQPTLTSPDAREGPGWKPAQYSRLYRGGRDNPSSGAQNASAAVATAGRRVPAPSR